MWAIRSICSYSDFNLALVFCHYNSVIRTQARTSSPGTRRSENRKSFECKECNADYYENEQGRL